LPVYVLIISAFFPYYSGTVLFSIYLFGILLAALMAVVFKKTIFKKKGMPFVMELPPYRMPTLLTTSRHMWSKASQYLKKMGGVILIASVIIWALGYFPRPDSEPVSQEAAQPENMLANNDSSAMMAEDVNVSSGQQIKESYIGQLGHFVEPVIEPLGFDWRMGVALISGVAAKEIVVSTLGVLYQSEDDSKSLVENLKEATYDEQPGKKVYTPLTSIAFMLFILIYFPCLATIVAIKSESGSWKWAILAAGYTTVLAWLVAFIVYQGGNLIF